MWQDQIIAGVINSMTLYEHLTNRVVNTPDIGIRTHTKKSTAQTKLY